MASLNDLYITKQFYACFYYAALNEFTEYGYTLVGSENNRRKCTRQISSFPLVCILQDLISGQLRILIAQGANVCRIYIACKLDV